MVEVTIAKRPEAKAVKIDVAYNNTTRTKRGALPTAEQRFDFFVSRADRNPKGIQPEVRARG